MKHDELHRRDFLKISTLLGASLIIPRRLDYIFNNNESWPGLDIKDLSPFYRDVLLRTPDLDFSASGIMQMRAEENGVHVMRDIPVDQTMFNKKFLDLATRYPGWRFVADQPIGLAWHWFGDGPEFAARWYPNGTAREYVEGGLCGDNSVQFVVGDGVLEPGQKALDKKLSIVQAEFPDYQGNWIISAHIVQVDRSLLTTHQQHFCRAYQTLLEEYGFPDCLTGTIIQRLYQPGFNDKPNKQLVGIEIQGCLYDDPVTFPSPQKLANVLAVSLAIIKRNRISSPAYNAYGHEELDILKADPGKNFILGMKTLIGISALVSGDEALKDLVFGPFTLGGKTTKKHAIANYFSFIKNYFSITSTPQSYIYYWLRFFEFENIQKLVSRNLITDASL
jgi:hypothetical protein